MKITMIAAMDEQRAIGKDGELPWSMPRDEAFLYDEIRGKTLLTGRTSYESNQGSTLYDDCREVILLTSQRDYRAEGASIAHSIEEALTLTREGDNDELMIMGGATVYERLLPYADQLTLTIIHTIIGGDTFFPAFQPESWNEIWREPHRADAENPYDFTFIKYQR